MIPGKPECTECDGKGGKTYRHDDGPMIIEVFEPCRRCKGVGREPTKDELLEEVKRLENKVRVGRNLAIEIIKEALDPNTPETPLAAAAMRAWDTLNIFDKNKVRAETGVENIRTRITGGEAFR